MMTLHPALRRDLAILCLSTLENLCEISLLLQQIRASKGGVKG